MEALYLLFSITSSIITSTFFSLLLAVRSLRLLFAGGGGGAAPAAVQLYEGRVCHARKRPVVHAFEYPVRYALIDLDLSPQPPHLSADRAREVAGTDGAVLLLTVPASVGYEQNPLSVYYCYDGGVGGDGEGSAPRLKSCIAEVTNTPWGEKVFFAFDPVADVVPKPLHVSPFMDMLGNWSIRANAPDNDLFLLISVNHPTLGNYFTAKLTARRVNSSSSSLNMAIYFWLMPHKVALWIYWQAVKLWWKGVSFQQHPKYLSPSYKDDAMIRDQELHCPLKFGMRANSSNYTVNKDSRNRWCVWRDAKWPWS